MRWRQVVVLWLVAGSLAAHYWLVDRRRPVVHPAERPERRRLLAAMASNEVVGVRMERGGTAVALRRYGETWTVEQPAGGHVAGGLIQAFVESLTAIEEIERLPADGGDARGFGLDENALRVYVSDAGGRELALVVGGSNASGTAVYARVGDAPGPVLIGRNLEYYASLILDEVRRSAEPAGDGPVAAGGGEGREVGPPGAAAASSAVAVRMAAGATATPPPPTRSPRSSAAARPILAARNEFWYSIEVHACPSSPPSRPTSRATGCRAR